MALRSRHLDLLLSFCGQASMSEGRSPRGPHRNMGKRNRMYPHGGLRPSHQTSTCRLHAIDCGAVCGAKLVTSHPTFRGNESRVVHRVAVQCGSWKRIRGFAKMDQDHPRALRGVPKVKGGCQKSTSLKISKMPKSQNRSGSGFKAKYPLQQYGV